MTAVLSAFGLRRRPSFQDRLVGFLIQWALLTTAVWVAATLVDGIHWDGWESLVLVALILGLLNAILRPLLFLISLPLTILTLGLFVVVLNSIMLWLAGRVADHIDRIHFHVDDFFWASILGAIVISVVMWLLGIALRASRTHAL